MIKTIRILMLLSLIVGCQMEGRAKSYSLWYDCQAPNRGGTYDTPSVAGGVPYDKDWENWALPIGNGSMGACIFGRTDTERIQISEKSMCNRSFYNTGGITNFAEVYLDFGHAYSRGYRRSLLLDDAMVTVAYEHDGVRYSREYFASYPAQIVAVKVRSDKPGMLSFAVRPKLPYLKPYNAQNNGRTGEISVNGDLLVLRGETQYYNLAYEGQIKVINYGGILSDNHKDRIEVLNADSAVLYIAAATSYCMEEKVFLLEPSEKVQGNTHPHLKVSKRIENAASVGYETLRREHLLDYQALFDRVDIDLGDVEPDIPTDRLLVEYRNGKYSKYLEELIFQYGRYLLIASSRKGTLPAHLQGAWTQYDLTPWTGGYWHNINVQMNYWPAFTTNLLETFESYVDYNETFRKKAVENAVQYIARTNPLALDRENKEENGWAIGTGATPYRAGLPGSHSGPGTGGFTTKLFWEYYDFTRDRQLLQEHVYPALLGMAKFLAKTLVEQPDGTLLVNESFSPEQFHHGVPYRTKGCTFDQSMIYECYKDLIAAADILNIRDPFVEKVKIQITKLDPILIGESGQIKEYREETRYGEIGDPHHRHISHLCALYPGTTITSNTPEWMKAAIVTLNGRGDRSTGWAMAFRQGMWARAKQGERSYVLLQHLLTEGTYNNLWGKCPPFQIDSNFGITAAIAEMLLQSHEGFIDLLPAIPQVWQEGSFRGLKARGNFTISAAWRAGIVEWCRIKSEAGTVCVLKDKIGPVSITNSQGRCVRFSRDDQGNIRFRTTKGETYILQRLRS